jgi:hypothetical protein
VHIVLLIVLSAGSFAVASESKSDIESSLHSGFKTVEKFGALNISLKGSAEQIGLNKNDLIDYLRQRFKNSFSEMEFKEQENISEMPKDKEKAKKIAIIHIKIWTVGDDYPIAYHIAINAGNLANMREYQAAILGYGSRLNVPESVRKSIAQLVDDLAITFFKARSEL